MSKLHVHIGHHYFGAGNLGDDLMLEGFLTAARPAWLAGVRLTCCIPHDIPCQRLRFPEIDWLPYDPVTRAACIRECDVWLGLGDTPFQATGGYPWFLDHLCQEAAWCRKHGVPMFYLGVGVNEREAVAYPQTRALVAQAEHLWMRDDDTLAMLGDLAAPGQATAQADLAHLALEAMRFPPPEPGTLGLVLNFEDPTQFHVEQLVALVRLADDRRVRWLAQEVRPMPGSETRLHAELPPGVRAAAPLRTPDYAGAVTTRALLTDWEGLDALFVSRYHATLIGAWMGARIAVFARSDKVAGAARQLGLACVDGMGDAPAILRAVDAARPVERSRLLDLAARSRQACEEFFSLARERHPRPGRRSATVGPGEDGTRKDASAPVEFSPMPSHPPTRILLLRPDAYGDLFLFEPVPRLLREAWPQAEVAVLIRQPYADAAPLAASAGVRWLTTACNPYREGPGDRPTALAALRDTVRAFAPDCVVAACSEQTWLEPAVAAFLPQARQVSLGDGLTDPLARAALDDVLPVDWQAIYPEKIPVEPALSEWEKNLRLASALLGYEAPRWWPVANVPTEAGARAARIVADAGLTPGEFVACAAAGTANVQIKSWPAEHYGETLAWLEREHGVRALLVGHISEQAHLEGVRQAVVRHGGGEPALWLGQDGEMPVVAGLLAAARFYFGNDTGALHLAAALGRPVASIFGGGHWPRFQPVARRSLTVVQPLPCFGCAWDCYFVDAPCVRTISPAAVQRALSQFLQDDADGQTIVEAEGLDPGARALIDTAIPRLRFLREDSVARLLQTREVTALLHASEADRDSRLRELQISEADRDARLRQVDELTAVLRVSETDRDSRLRELRASEADRDARLHELRASEADRDARLRELQISEADRDARLRQVDELTAELRASEADRAAREAQVKELTALLKASETDRDARGKQVATLTPLLQASDADRDARQLQVKELTALLKTSDADRDARQLQVTELTALFKASEIDRDARGKQVAELTVWHKNSEADRLARGKQIDELTAWLVASDADREAQAKLIAELDARLRANEAERIAQGRHIQELTARLTGAEATPAVLPGAPEVADLALGAMEPTAPESSVEEDLPALTPGLTPPPASDTPVPSPSGTGVRPAASGAKPSMHSDQTRSGGSDRPAR